MKTTKISRSLLVMPVEGKLTSPVRHKPAKAMLISAGDKVKAKQRTDQKKSMNSG